MKIQRMKDWVDTYGPFEDLPTLGLSDYHNDDIITLLSDKHGRYAKPGIHLCNEAKFLVPLEYRGNMPMDSTIRIEGLEEAGY